MTRVRITRRTLAWGECDPAGIIFYPNYCRCMDEATWAMLAQAGSFGLAHEFALASESRVWCRYEAGPGRVLRSVPIPDGVRAALGAS